MYTPPIIYGRMGEDGLRRWVQANPSKVNDLDYWGERPLHAAAYFTTGSSVLRFLIDEHGADMDARMVQPGTLTFPAICDNVPLHCAVNREAVDVLLTRGANPLLTTSQGWTPLHMYIYKGRWPCVERYLSDPRARDVVNATALDEEHLGQTALHFLCTRAYHRGGDRLNEWSTRTRMIRLLLQAGADPTIKDVNGRLPADLLPTRSRQSALLLRQSVDDTQNSLFVIKARRFLVADTCRNVGWITRRLACGEKLPCVSLSFGAGGRKRRNDLEVRDLLAFLVGLDGPSGNVLPSGVFIIVMKFLVR